MFVMYLTGQGRSFNQKNDKYHFYIPIYSSDNIKPSKNSKLLSDILSCFRIESVEENPFLVKIIIKDHRSLSKLLENLGWKIYHPYLSADTWYFSKKKLIRTSQVDIFDTTFSWLLKGIVVVKKVPTQDRALEELDD